MHRSGLLNAAIQGISLFFVSYHLHAWDDLEEIPIEFAFVPMLVKFFRIIIVAYGTKDSVVS